MKDPFDPLDKEEEMLMRSLEADEWLPVENRNEEIRKLREAAKAALKKTERINIRISGKDLRKLKARAIEEGVPYQTLVSSLIHKYLSGRLAEKRS